MESSNNSNSNNGTIWIYHERQEALLCGQHALNNLLQSNSFTPADLANIAHQLDQKELTYFHENNSSNVPSRDLLRRMAEGSNHVDESGNFSLEVLSTALLTRPLPLTLLNTDHPSVRSLDVTSLDGFICNKEAHWFAIRKIGDLYWNLNSMKERPEWISHFRLSAEVEALKSSGYSVFCVLEVGLLPKPFVEGVDMGSAEERDLRGKAEFWWREKDLREERKNAMQGSKDPWRNVGTGMRLDGKSTNDGGGVGEGGNLEGLTEEEMIHMAIAASMQPESSPSTTNDTNINTEVRPRPEPKVGEEGSIRIQFRLPTGAKKERRFFKEELVDVLYSHVDECCPIGNGGDKLELRAGYPSCDLKKWIGQTICEANLAGEMVQCRHIS